MSSPIIITLKKVLKLHFLQNTKQGNQGDMRKSLWPLVFSGLKALRVPFLKKAFLDMFKQYEYQISGLYSFLFGQRVRRTWLHKQADTTANL